VPQRKLTCARTAVSVGMAPAGAKVSLDPAAFMMQSKRFIGCLEGDSIPAEVGTDCSKEDCNATDTTTVHTEID
jgi:hypothetical protein